MVTPSLAGGLGTCCLNQQPHEAVTTAPFRGANMLIHSELTPADTDRSTALMEGGSRAIWIVLAGEPAVSLPADLSR